MSMLKMRCIVLLVMDIVVLSVSIVRFSGVRSIRVEVLGIRIVLFVLICLIVSYVCVDEMMLMVFVRRNLEIESVWLC